MATPRKSSLIYYVASVMGLSSLLAVTALLAVYFWVSRPVNLHEETDRLADAVADALIAHYVPAANTVRSEPTGQSEVRNGMETRWNAVAFTVTLPASVAPDTLKAAIRKDMSDYFVKLVEEERESGTGNERFSLYYDNLPFATITLVPAKVEAAPTYRSDLRNASDTIAETVHRELTAMGLNPPHTRAAAVEQEDLNALWRYTAFTAALPQGMTVGALRERLEGLLNQPDIRFDTTASMTPHADLVIRTNGKACVGISCILPPPAAHEGAPAPVTLDEALDAELEGSEPDEVTMPETESPEMVVTPVPVETETATPAPEMTPEAPKSTETPTPVVEDSAAPTETGPPPDKSMPASDYSNLPPGSARLAILIDDGGNNSSHGDRILALDNRLTLAILPNTPFGAEIAESGAEKGFEIMLHMPMETDSETVRSVPGTVFTKMGKEEIQKLTNEAIDQIPHVVGINNHTGSKFTSNREKMDFVLEVLKDRSLYFIDSVTIHTSVAFEAAREAGVPSARRDVFLDDATDIASVRRQFELLVRTAKEQGAAIGIGHFQCPATARVLAEEIPKLAEAGIELVHASELVQ